VKRHFNAAAAFCMQNCEKNRGNEKKRPRLLSEDRKTATTNFCNVCFWSGRSSMQAVVGKNVFYAGSHIMSGSAGGEKKREAK
jgi:hypothetical protein